MARMLNKLTSKQVDALGPGRHSDGGGLYLDRDGSGRSRWIFMWKRGNLRREMGIGSAGREGVSLKAAREAANEARKIVEDGGDPIDARNAPAAEPIRVPTFGEVADSFVRSQSPQWRNEKHRSQWQMTLTVYAEPLRALQIDDVTTEAVLSVLKPIWLTRAETASRLRGRIERVLDAGKAAGHRTGENPARWRGHLELLLPKRHKLTRGHHKAMPFDTISNFMASLRARQAVAAWALEFLILTAARSGEVLGATWGEIDLKQGVWTVPANRMKAGREHRVPLSARALEVLQAACSLHGSPTGFEGIASEPVFPTARGGRMSSMAMAMLMRRMEQDFTVHGFRSTFRDWASEVSHFPSDLAEAALAHTVGDAVERAYRRGDALEKRRSLMEAWSGFLAPLRSGSTVVAIGA